MGQQTAGILIANDVNLQSRMAYPSALHTVGRETCLIDSQILQLAAAGIETAILICKNGDIPTIATALGKERHGVKLIFEKVVSSERLTVPAILYKACRRAEYKLDFTNFAIILPNAHFDHPFVIADILEVDDFPAVALFDRTPGAFFINWEIMKRWKEQVDYEDRPLLDTLENDRELGQLYREVLMPGRYWNFNDFGELQEFMGANKND